MKSTQTTTHLVKAMVVLGITVMPFLASAQLKVSGLLFGDYDYKVQADSMAKKGRKTNSEYYGLPQNYSGFNIRRAYLNFNYDVNSRIHVEAVLAHESSDPPTTSPVPTPSAQEVLPDNNNAVYLKYANVRYKGLFPGTDLILGQQRTPTFCTNNGSEPIWQYRPIERTITDFRKIASSTDLGIGLEGKYMNGDLGYNVLFANGLGAKEDETLPTASSNAPKTYANVYYKIAHHLEIQLYGDYQAFNFNWDSTKTKYQTSTSMIKLFVAYVMPKYAVGVEAFQQTNTNAADDINGHLGAASPNGVSSSTGSLANLRSTTPMGVSIFAHCILIQGDTAEASKRIGTMQDGQKGGVLSVFARYDFFNPDGNMTDALAVNKINKGSYQSTEYFITAGLDWQINKNVHIMPNIWYDGFVQKDDQSITNYVPKNGDDMVARLSLWYQF